MSDDGRLEDYLNDKLQTLADFDALNSLIASVQSQQALLQQQLRDVRRDVAETRETSVRHNANLDQQIRAFQSQQANIDRRLMVVTQSDTPDDAVRRFNTSMDMLNRLDTATMYLELITEVEALSKEANSQLLSSPQTALDSYRTLWHLSASLQDLQTEAEGAATHLVHHIEKTKSTLRESLRNSFAKDLNKILGTLLWPKPQTAMPVSLEMSWTIAIKRLLELQMQELEARVQENMKRGTYREPLVLLPLQVMVQPLEVRFQYHFSGEKTTNRLDKPEYFLLHVVDLIRSHETFVDDYIQPILFVQFRTSSIALDLAYFDATSALITALLPMVRSKVFALVQQVSSQPQLLSHLMHELMGFDMTLRDEFKYSGSTTVAGAVWKGITWEVLVQKDWFGRWLQVEKDFALARYQAIVDEPDSSTLDYDSVESKSTKPTKAAIRVNDLLEAITDRYRPLSSFTQKLSFLIDIQIAIFDSFHARLHSALETFLSMNSTIGRTVQGISASEMASIQGISGLDRLCRVFGSADYLEKKMRDWSDDVFFLDLWSKLQSRARTDAPLRPSSSSGTKKGSFLAGSRTIADVASRTSSTLGSGNEEDNMEETDGALFDETAGAYARLRIRSEGVIIETLTSRLRDALRPYSKNSSWSSLGSSDTVISGPSADLLATLEVLEEGLKFLANALGLLALRKIARAIAKVIDTYVFDRVICAHFFALPGAKQVKVDVHALALAFEAHVGEAVGQSGLRKCIEATQLLGLKIKGVDANQATQPDGTDAAWEVGQDDSSIPSLGLWQVEKRLFASNDSARDVLEQLGLESLAENPQEARQILRRRVELAS